MGIELTPEMRDIVGDGTITYFWTDQDGAYKCEVEDGVIKGFNKYVMNGRQLAIDYVIARGRRIEDIPPFVDILSEAMKDPKYIIGPRSD
jgi:hypothetical protein